MPVPEALRGAEGWKGLRSIGLATLVCQRDGQETGETRYYLSSLPVGVKRFARAIRSHWSIENGCHWSLDLTFREDESRIREPQARERTSTIAGSSSTSVTAFRSARPVKSFVSRSSTIRPPSG